MQCPKCRQAMAPVAAPYGATVERCGACAAIVCNDHALTMLQRQWFLWPESDPRSLDVGSVAEGRRWNALREVACPSCAKPMVTVTAPGQEHIDLERCAPCGLTLFDAGEMTDLRYRTMADWVRGWARAARGDGRR
jgi:uncharacterized protein